MVSVSSLPDCSPDHDPKSDHQRNNVRLGDEVGPEHHSNKSPFQVDSDVIEERDDADLFSGSLQQKHSHIPHTDTPLDKIVTDFNETSKPEADPAAKYQNSLLESFYEESFDNPIVNTLTQKNLEQMIIKTSSERRAENPALEEKRAEKVPVSGAQGEAKYRIDTIFQSVFGL